MDPPLRFLRRWKTIWHDAGFETQFDAHFLNHFGAEIVRANSRDLPVLLLETNHSHKKLRVAVNHEAQQYRFALESCALVDELRRPQLRWHIRMNVDSLPKPTALAFELFASDFHQVPRHIDGSAVEHERE